MNKHKQSTSFVYVIIEFCSDYRCKLRRVSDCGDAVIIAFSLLDTQIAIWLHRICSTGTRLTGKRLPRTRAKAQTTLIHSQASSSLSN